jgi:hypothetical protein
MLTTTTTTDAADVIGASGHTRGAVSLSSTVNNVSTHHAASPMLSTINIIGASRKARDAVNLINTVDSVGIYCNIAIVTIYKCGRARQLRLCFPVKTRVALQ